MIIVNGKKYATTEAELIDSLFNEGGTLDLIEVKERKNEILFFTDKEKKRGFWKSKKNDCYGQFSKREKGYFFQFTTAEVKFL